MGVSPLVCLISWTVGVSSLVCLISWTVGVSSLVCLISWTVGVSSLVCLISWTVGVSSLLCLISWTVWIIFITSYWGTGFINSDVLIPHIFQYPFILSMQFELGSLETRHSPSHPQIYTSAGVLPAHHDFLGMGSCGGKRTAGYTAEPHIHKFCWLYNKSLSILFVKLDPPIFWQCTNANSMKLLQIIATFMCTVCIALPV